MRQSSHVSHMVTQGAVRSSHVSVRECLRETVSGGSVVAVGVDREDRIVARKVSSAGSASSVPWNAACSCALGVVRVVRVAHWSRYARVCRAQALAAAGVVAGRLGAKARHVFTLQQARSKLL